MFKMECKEVRYGQVFIGRFGDKNEAVIARQLAEKDRYEQGYYNPAHTKSVTQTC